MTKDRPFSVHSMMVEDDESTISMRVWGKDLALAVSLLPSLWGMKQVGPKPLLVPEGGTAIDRGDADGGSIVYENAVDESDISPS